MTAIDKNDLRRVKVLCASVEDEILAKGFIERCFLPNTETIVVEDADKFEFLDEFNYAFACIEPNNILEILEKRALELNRKIRYIFI